MVWRGGGGEFLFICDQYLFLTYIDVKIHSPYQIPSVLRVPGIFPCVPRKKNQPCRKIKKKCISVVVEALCYKAEGKLFFFSIYLICPAAIGSGVYSSSNRNEYQNLKINVSGE
jgi:hypothetical protein